MYPEKVPYWQRGQLITAERLNKAVRMLNWLLDIAADNDSDQQDDGENGGDVNVLPPGGSIPPTPYYDNPPVEVVDAAGQPFLKLGELIVETVPPPVFALKPAIPGEVPGTPYYTNVTTDSVGKVESVEVSEAPVTFQLWDGTVKGSFSVCSGALIQDEFGEFHTFDANPFFLPVLPVSLFPACGSATNANGDSITVHNLVDTVVGNSVPIKPLVAGAGVVITEEVSAGETPAGYLVISAGTSGLDAAGQPFIAPGPSGNISGTDVQYLIPPVAGNAERSSPDIPGTPYYTNVTTDNFGRPTNVSVSSSMMTTQLWDGSAGGVFSACTGALNADENGNYYSIDSNPIFLPVIPISFFGACGNATNDNGDSVEVHNLVDSAVGNSVPIKPLVAGEGIVLTDGLLPTGYVDSSGEASLRAGYVQMSLSALTYQPEASSSSPSYEPSLGGLRSVTYATASEVAAGTQFPRVENGNLVLFPGAVAYDSNKFALVKQGSFWVLTIPETDCTPTVGTPLFAAD